MRMTLLSWLPLFVCCLVVGVNGQIGFYANDGVVKMETAMRLDSRAKRIADSNKRLGNNAMVASYVAAARQELYDEYKDRGSKYLADGTTVIVENENLDVTVADPREDNGGFANPFYQVNHVRGLFQDTTSPAVIAAMAKVAPATMTSPWKQINGIGSLHSGNSALMKPQLITLLNASPNKIIRFLCESCTSPDHQQVYYKRLTPAPSNLVDILEYSWTATNNVLNTDFQLFSTYEDAVRGTSAWTFCGGYDQGGVGFPGTCGPTSASLNQYVNFQTKTPQSDVSYYVEDANGDFTNFAMTEYEKTLETWRQTNPTDAKASDTCMNLPSLDSRIMCWRSCSYGEKSDNLSALKLCRIKRIEGQMWKTKSESKTLELSSGTEQGGIIKSSHALGTDDGLPSSGTF